MLALLKLLFAILLLLNVAVFLLFIFWPADRVKQIRETLAHVNITEKYFSGEKSKRSQSLVSKGEIKESKNWKERSPKDLKVYLSERGVELTEMNSEEYLGEILGNKSIHSSTGINLLRPEGRDLSAGELLTTSRSSHQVSTTESQLIKLAENKLSAPYISNLTSITYSGLESEVVLRTDEAMILSTATVDYTTVRSNLNEVNIEQSSVNFVSQESNPLNTQLGNELIENDISSEDSLIQNSESKMNTHKVTVLNSRGFLESKTQSIGSIPTATIDKEMQISGNNKIYELNALIYNPLELTQPEAIFVECSDKDSIKVYLPSNIIENTNGTYLSQDHLELWLDRTSIKPRTGYGRISHQFGIGLKKNPWVIDFLQNDSDWELKVTVLKKGDILVITIQNLPPDLRAWNIVFSKSVKEGKNWVQGQLVSAVEKFTWGNPDRLIPFHKGFTDNATQ